MLTTKHARSELIFTTGVVMFNCDTLATLFAPGHRRPVVQRGVYTCRKPRVRWRKGQTGGR